MSDCRVTCINLVRGGTRHEHITHIGGPGGGGWKLTEAEAINQIENKTNTFFVLDDLSGKRANVGVVREAGRTPFLRTHADGVWTDNLLSLPQCS